MSPEAILPDQSKIISTNLSTKSRAYALRSLHPTGVAIPTASPMALRHVSLSCLWAIATLSLHVTALQYVAGGKCESVCSNEVAGNLYDDVVCLDDGFDSGPGSLYKACVTCQLNSTSVDSGTGFSDVDWALYNLRYSLSNCMFAYPVERISISSPCQVTCAPLQRAITHGVQNTTDGVSATANFDFCTSGQFDDTTINNCAFCYSFIPQQLFLGNFLQSLHIACHANPEAGKTFYPDGVAIFNESTIAGPSPSAPKPTGSSGLTGGKLALAVVLPLVGGVAILVGVCFGCWHFTRKRRSRMAASGRMSRFHDGQVTEYSPMTPKGTAAQNGLWSEPAREMESITVVPKMSGSQAGAPGQRNSPRSAQGRWDGQADDEAGAPLNGADRTSYVREETSLTGGQVKDPNLHEQYFGGESRSRPVSESVRVPDGFAREPTQGGWTQH